jgi:hypothetical protein
MPDDPEATPYRSPARAPANDPVQATTNEFGFARLLVNLLGTFLGLYFLGGVLVTLLIAPVSLAASPNAARALECLLVGIPAYLTFLGHRFRKKLDSSEAPSVRSSGASEEE